MKMLNNDAVSQRHRENDAALLCTGRTQNQLNQLALAIDQNLIVNNTKAARTKASRLKMA